MSRIRSYSLDEFDEKMKDVDGYVDGVIAKLGLSGTDSLLFFSMATAVSAYHAGYVLDDTREMVQSLFGFSLFTDREAEYGTIGPSDIGQDEYFELFDMSQDLMQYFFKKLSDGEPGSDKERIMVFQDVLWEIAHMPVSIARRTADPEEAGKTMLDDIGEVWRFIEGECKVVYD